jgi:hypothetical protein
MICSIRMYTHANAILRNSRVPAANLHSCRPFSGRTKSLEDKSAVEGGRAAEGHTGRAGEWHAEEVGRIVSQTLRASFEEPAQQFHPVRTSLEEQARQRMAMAGMSARERERELLSRMRSSIPGGRDGVYTGALYPGLSLRYRGFLDSRRSVQPGPKFNNNRLNIFAEWFINVIFQILRIHTWKNVTLHKCTHLYACNLE